MRLKREQYKALIACVDLARSQRSFYFFTDEIVAEASEGLEEISAAFGASEVDEIALEPLLK